MARIFLILASMAAAVMSSALPHTISRGCATPHQPIKGLDVTEQEVSAYQAQLVRNPALKPQEGPKTVNVFFHVISDALGEGNVSDSDVIAQVDVLNADFAGNYVFNLAEITRTINDVWFTSAGPDDTLQTDMKESLRRGNASDLNVYSVGFKAGSGEGLLGYATFPSDYAQFPLDDGVIGHWLGLYHTFQGGCFGGDLVDDTPAEASPAFGCPTGRDTCAGLPGLDPIENFMDYTWDNCMNQFSLGQYERAAAQVGTYRGL
ncbi:hypothetical protein BC829DRAFT_395182 [Chytridium lagenaria]|nr:hypothetical protein BC829DRAFT_395182 [Chytridium lagenaria]